MIDDTDVTQFVRASLGREGSVECLFGHKEISMCKSGLGDWGNISSARRSGAIVRLPLHDAGAGLEEATKMQETQMSFNLHLPGEPGACYKTPAAEAWGNAVEHRADEAQVEAPPASRAACEIGAASIVRWEGPDLDAIVCNGHAGLGT